MRDDNDANLGPHTMEERRFLEATTDFERGFRMRSRDQKRTSLIRRTDE